MKILVIGATGFIGSHTLTLARRLGHHALGTQCRSRREGLVAFEVLKDRITDCVAPDFLEGTEPLFAVHCAGLGGVDACLKQQNLSRMVNVERTRRLIEDLHRLGACQVYLSSSYVFDGSSGPYRETDQCSPVNEYGRQKVAVEEFLMEKADRSLVLRLDKVVGVRPEESHLLTEWHLLARSERPIQCIRGQILSLTSVDDVAAAILTACEQQLRGIYHVAGNEAAYRDVLAKQFLAAIGLSAAVELRTQEELGLADRRPIDTSLDSTKFRVETHLEFTPIPRVFNSFVENTKSDGLNTVPRKREAISHERENAGRGDS